MTRLERWLARLYFVGASGLFVFAQYQTQVAASALEKKDRMMPAHLEKAFEAGCKQINKHGCKDAAQQFRKEQEQIYN